MPRAAIIVGFAWPFIVAVFGGVMAAVLNFGDFATGALLALSFAGAPIVAGAIHRVLPEPWSEPGRVLLAIGLAVPVILAEVYAAAFVFLVVFMVFGGYIPC